MISAPFKYWGNFDISFFLKAVSYLDWHQYTERQEKRFGMQDTYTIPLIWDIKLEERKEHPSYNLFKPELEKLSAILNDKLGAGKIFTCVLTKLPAGKQIDLHVDKLDFFSNSSRIHIPIITNDDCIFRVGKETQNMKVGEMWEICNHGMLHGTQNNGTTDRVHLMIDWDYEEVTNFLGGD